MKYIFALICLLGAGAIGFFFTSPQYMCSLEKCGYNGIKTLKQNIESYNNALTSAQSLEDRRAELTNKYNSITADEIKRIEEFLPNNVDNIKLVLELETLAKRYGLLIENPKLETKQDDKTAAPVNGQAIRDSNVAAGLNSALPYGSFTLDFTVRTNYLNMKNLVRDMERNLRLIEPVSIVVSVPDYDSKIINPKKKLNPKGVYDVNIKAVIYYLKN